MDDLVNSETRVVVQGITGSMGSRHTETMLEYGTRIVAGVRPGAEGQEVHGVPVYNTVKTAVEKHDANTSILFVPPTAVKQGAIEAITAGIKLLVLVSEHIPIQDTMELLEHARMHGARIIGPNTAGMIAPWERCKIGFVPNKYFIPGPISAATRSGTLMYEIISRITLLGIGQSICVGAGGDSIVGTRFAELLKIYEKDPKTELSILIGEVGGTQEEEAAALVKSGAVVKPVLAYIAGRSAPKGKRMGHAGALISGDTGTMESKLRAFADAEVPVAKTPEELIQMVNAKLRR